MSDTPRTDAAARMPTDCHPTWVVPVDLARELERENAIFRAAQKACDDCDAPTMAEIEKQHAIAHTLCQVIADLLRQQALHAPHLSASLITESARMALAAHGEAVP